MEGSDVRSGKSLILDQKFEGLLDDRNLDLWMDISRCHTLKLEESPEPGYLTYFDAGTFIIEVDMEAVDPAAFTHELLHVYLKTKGVTIAWDLKEKIRKIPKMELLLSTSLRVHIGNCLEHIKMLPLFLSRGYAREDFLMDYHKRIMDAAQLKKLEECYQVNGRVSTAAADLYIEKFFSMKASPNDFYDYGPYFSQLQKMDSSLYGILQEFWGKWEMFKVGDPKENYLTPLDHFLKEMKRWKGDFLISG